VADENNANDTALDELSSLKARATLMGITFSNNIGIDGLRKKIDAKLNDGDDDAESTEEVSDNEKPKTRQQITKEICDKQLALIRVRIQCLDPKKKDLPGEVISIANEFMGTVSKFVPFGEVTEDGYHLPYCIYRHLEDRRFLNIRTVKDARTKINKIEQTWAKEFAIEVLPQLTPEELKDLATAQAAAGSIENAASTLA
jgi:hypothetical protein